MTTDAAANKLDTDAGDLAAHLETQDYVEVYGHHDADGIAAASIITHALLRTGTNVRLRISPRVSPDEVQGTDAVVLCDFGSGLADLSDDVMVIDHHIPQFEGRYHVNPRLCGIDGERNLSAAGAAYMVAQHMGDNRDLVGLAMLGMIGDGQAIEGKNLELVDEGIAQNYIVPGRGIPLFGRDVHEKVYCAAAPYIHGFSGNEDAVTALVEETTVRGETDYDLLLSRLVLAMGPVQNDTAMTGIWGDTWDLQRGMIRDAHSLAAVINACGKTGHGGLGASLCLRSTASVDEAWEIAREYRLRVIEAVKTATTATGPVYVVDDPDVVSGAADVLAGDLLNAAPLAVMAPRGENWSVSARSAGKTGCNLAELMATLAAECGGVGGGHATRGGAKIPAETIEAFKNGFMEVCA
ncbi:hypothetical protein AZH53_03770 [Methanomicrobiaceae archaeon CYW5]|uniref:DHH family phosphoesterase n=1 Tax=Methanovulcanius yangii TaxID=1789227 RepID=UPI0029C9FD42|nr:DHH family phosphoesterase [Methanovulcanius yangii]MBT8507539.1 hypothetical protein [Methanovulcanius yangii]